MSHHNAGQMINAHIPVQMYALQEKQYIDRSLKVSLTLCGLVIFEPLWNSQGNPTATEPPTKGNLHTKRILRRHICDLTGKGNTS